MKHARPRKDKLTVPNAFHAVSAFMDNELYWNKTLEFLRNYIAF